MKKVLVLTMSLVVLFMLAACNIGDDSLKVGLIVSAAGANDNGYNESAIEGLNQAAEEYDITTQVVTSADDIPGSLELLAEDGFDLIFSLEYDFDALIHDDGSGQSIAEKYPDTTFVIFNDFANTDGESKIHNNVIEVLFNVNEASFLAGAVATLVNENHDVLFTSDDYDFADARAMGFVGGTMSNGILVFGYGFAQGINYIAEDLDVNYDFYQTYSAGFGASQGNYNTIDSYYNSGVNIVFAAAGGVSTNMKNAAASNGRLSIDVDADLDDSVPGSVLTSVLKNTNVPVYELVSELVDGTLEGGRELFYDLDSGATGITGMVVIEEYIAETTEAQTTWQDIKAQIDTIRDLIADGTIDVVDAQKGESLEFDDLPNVNLAN